CFVPGGGALLMLHRRVYARQSRALPHAFPSGAWERVRFAWSRSLHKSSFDIREFPDCGNQAIDGALVDGAVGECILIAPCRRQAIGRLCGMGLRLRATGSRGATPTCEIAG